MEEDDLYARVEGLLEVTPWEALTESREDAFTRLLELATSHSLLDRAVCALVRRFLLQGDPRGTSFADDPWRYFVLRCAARVAFRADGSGRLLQELRYVGAGGSAVKLLLDTADFALRSGLLDYAADALAALDVTVAESAGDGGRGVTDVLIYRLPYVDERLAAWMVARMSFLWMVEPHAMARLVDDCAIECPKLAPVLANKTTYRPCPGVERYKEHAAFIQTLFTPIGRAIALESYVYVPTQASLAPETVEYFLAFFDALRRHPESEVAATRLLRWWADDLAQHQPETLPETIAAWRALLPERPQWPREPRDSSYEQDLESLALSFMSGVSRRSTREDENSEPDDWGERERIRSLVRRLDQTERDLFARTRKRRWGFS